MAPAALGAAMLWLSGCYIILAGVNQDMQFKTAIPDVEVHMNGQSCRAPCTLKVRRQWGTFDLQAVRGDEVVVSGPIYPRDDYDEFTCAEERSTLSTAAFIDGFLFVPGIVDLSTGTIVWHPRTVVIEQGAYTLEDRCFAKPAVGGPK